MDSGETDDSVDPKASAWGKFVSKADKFINSGGLEGKVQDMREIAYKFAAAREAVLCSPDDWADSLKRALNAQWPKGFHFIRENFDQWYRENPDDARKALRMIWTDRSLSDTERISAFSEHLPQKAVYGKRSRRTRTTVIAVLLMGLDVEKYPPLMIRRFEYVYKRTGYPQPKTKNDEAVLYEHALGFLDQFIEEARARGVHLRHRLDAQLVVWHFLNDDDLLKLDPRPPAKTLKALAEELLLSSEFLEEIRTLLYDKRQIIFQGPPGTGKTYVAQALANYLAAAEDRVTLVQFHPSYAYEDFARGFRPTITESGQAGFELQDGPLLRAAQEARKEPDAKHFLLIDEINRGNLAKVFGELYFLLEYRDKTIRMQYQQEGEDDFALPKNLYIIGTMNTADRSIALVDLALRRRFYFIEFHPVNDPVKNVLRKWLKKKNLDDLEGVADVVDKANDLLKDDRHAAIGPSYFMKEGLDKRMVERIWKHSVLPYVEERLFGDENRINRFNLRTLSQNIPNPISWNKDEEQKEDEMDDNAGGVKDEAN